MSAVARGARWSHLAGAGAVLVGAWWVKDQTDEAQKSRAERAQPGFVPEVCERLAAALDQWSPDERYRIQEHFVENLARHLRAQTGWQTDIWPDTPEGRPDILVDDLLALSVQVNPTESELYRCVGQCWGFSRLWVTWAVVIAHSETAAQMLDDVLTERGLRRVLVWAFPLRSEADRLHVG